MDDDAQWRNKVMDIVGCIPAFWKRFISNLYQNQSLPTCNREQYQRIDTEYSPVNNFEQAASLYMQPCKQMTTIVSATEKTIPNNKSQFELVLNFNHATEEYKETVNNEAVNVETLCSQIGGFVGIMIYV